MQGNIPEKFVTFVGQGYLPRCEKAMTQNIKLFLLPGQQRDDAGHVGEGDLQ